MNIRRWITTMVICAMAFTAAPAWAAKKGAAHTGQGGAGLNGEGVRVAVGVGGPGVPYGGDIGVNGEIGVTPQVGLTAGVGAGTGDGLTWALGARFYPWGFYPIGRSGLSISPHLIAMYGVVDGYSHWHGGYWHDHVIHGLTAGGGARVPVLSKSFVDLDFLVVLTDDHHNDPWPYHNHSGDLLLSLGFGWKL